MVGVLGDGANSDFMGEASLPPSLLPPSPLLLPVLPFLFSHPLSLLSTNQYLSDSDHIPCTVLGPGHEQQTLSDEAYIPAREEDTTTQQNKCSHNAPLGREGGEAAAAAGQAPELVQGAGGVLFI